MKNGLSLLLISGIFLVMTLGFVYAAGTSTGSQTPSAVVIDNISPSKGSFGQTIIITGKGFSTETNSVYFDDYKLYGYFPSPDGETIAVAYLGVPSTEVGSVSPYKLLPNGVYSVSIVDNEGRKGYGGSFTVEGNSESGIKNNYTKSTSKINCESFGTLAQRIKCRLEQQGIDGLNVTEESCRALANPANCMSLYNKVAACYDKSGVQKDYCFKRIAGFYGAKVSNQSANNKEALRYYAVFLLYDLQERIEKSYVNNETSATATADLISLIVQLKQAILGGKSKAETRLLFEQLKIKLRDYKIE